jgi:hypothetical protein
MIFTATVFVFPHLLKLPNFHISMHYVGAQLVWVHCEAELQILTISYLYTKASKWVVPKYKNVPRKHVTDSKERHFQR